MKEKLTKNLGIKLLSLPLAVLIWIVIINVDDPTITRTFTNIQVEILNADEVPSGQVYDIVEDTTISISVKGKRSILDEIDHSDLSATADLMNITAFNKVEIEPVCVKEPYAVELTANPKRLTVTFEQKVSEKFKINVEERGTVESGYYVGSTEAKPNMLEITGPESTVNKIKDVRVAVNVDGASESFSINNLVPVLYDEEGKEIDTSRLTFGNRRKMNIKVKVTILKTKVIPVEIITEGEPAEGFYILDKEYDPQEIEIAGTETLLQETDVLPIRVNVAGVIVDKEMEINLEEFLPEGVMIVGDMNTIALKITVGEMKTKVFDLRTSDIELRNLNRNLLYEYLSEDTIIEVSVRGTEEELKKLSVDDLKPYIDLKDKDEGTHVFEIQYDLEKEKATVISEATVSGRLYKEGPDSPTENQESVVTTPTIPTVSTESTMEPTESTEVPEQTEPSVPVEN